MATGTLIPLEEYLGHSFRPDCDYIDGELQERHLGEEEHSDLQARFLKLLLRDENERYIRANPELRVQVRPENFRVPDVCVRPRGAPRQRFVTEAPLLCIEILSPSDTVSGTRTRILEYLAMGVPEVWLVDAKFRTITVYNGSSIVEHSAGGLTVPQTPITLRLADIFSALDDYER
jgi:Uma2 family endonuclease